MRAHGIDISKWQETFRRVVTPPRPVDFVIQRLSYGRVQDERYNQFLPVVQQFIHGGYHYYSSAVGWQEQADFFIDRLRNHQFFAWDVEKGYNRPTTAWLNGIESAMDYITAQTGLPGVIYTGPDTWVTWLKPVRSRLLRFDLWVAHYWWIRATPESKPNYWTVRGADTMRRDWRFWQYDDKAQGGRGYQYGLGSKGGDLNVFNGTVSDLHTWLASEPPEPPAPPQPGAYVVNAETLKVFQLPDSNTRQVAMPLRRGTIVDVIRTQVNLGEEWAQIAKPDGWCRYAYLAQM